MACWGWGFSFTPLEGWQRGLLSPIAHEGGRGLLAYFLLSILYFLVFFLFGDLLPKKSARHNARAFAQRFVGLLCFLQAVAFPFLKLCALIVNGILRLCRIDPHILDDPVTEEEDPADGGRRRGKGRN